MKISVVQSKSEGSNEFEIKYDDNLKYKAKLPFVSIENSFNLEKLREMKILDVNGKEIYKTDYKYLDNLGEEFIPLKYLITGSQKFNQLLFLSDNNDIKIYFEENAIWKNRYVIELGEKRYYCYSIEDGYIRHFPIFDGENQVGEALKSNVVIDGRDEYYCYLKDGYGNLCDGIVALMLYLDRAEYSSSYLVNKSYSLEKKYSYNTNNKYYDNEWVKNNFGDEFYKKVDSDIEVAKEKISHPVKSFKEQLNELPDSKRKLLLFVLIAPWVLIVISLLIAFVVMVLFR